MKMQQFRRSARPMTSACIIVLSLGLGANGQENVSPGGPILERIEWTDIWVTNADKDDLPRVLFVGDSIARGYFSRTEKQLEGQANCARYATSAFIAHQDFLEGLKILLDRYDFDVIHINNGLHGWEYTEEQYRAGFSPLIKLLGEHAKDATIIWAMTTPLRDRDNLEKIREKSIDRVRERNRIAAEFIKKHNFMTSDLFSIAIDHPEYHRSDGTHFNAKGIEVQAKYIAGVVSQALKSRSGEAKVP